MYNIIKNNNVDREILNQLISLYKKDKVTSYMIELNLTDAISTLFDDTIIAKVMIDDKTSGISKNTYGVMLFPSKVSYSGEERYMVNLYIDKQMLKTINSESCSHIIAETIERTRETLNAVLNDVEKFYIMEQDFEDYVDDLFAIYKIGISIIEKNPIVFDIIDDLTVNKQLTCTYEIKDAVKNILNSDTSTMHKIEQLNLYNFIPKDLLDTLKNLYVDMKPLEVYSDNPEALSKFKFRDKLTALLPKSKYDDKSKVLDHDYRSPVDAQS